MLRSPQNPLALIPVQGVPTQTVHVLASAHALVKLDDDIAADNKGKGNKTGDINVVGDPMEKTTLQALGWQLKTSEIIEPGKDTRSGDGKAQPTLFIRRRFQFSSALKRMSTVCTVGRNGRSIASVKGAPETIKAFLAPGAIPSWYDETYKWYTRRGSRVLALAWKDLGSIGGDKVSSVSG